VRAGTSTLVDRGPGGQPADGYAEDAVISGNGRYVAFTSYASNLVAGDTNGERDVFVYDRVTGVTVRASVGTGNVQLDGFQSGPSISDDGRYVTFIETDYNHGVGQEAFVHDMRTGTTRQVTVPAGDAASSAVFEATLAGNGKRLAFSGTGDFAGDGGSVSGVYVTDLASGTTTRVSPQTAGDAGVDANSPSIDRAGDRVLFSTSAAIDPADTNGGSDIYLRDLSAGSTVLVSADHTGTGAGDDESIRGRLSANGRYAGFWSLASDLVAKPVDGGVTNVYRRDLDQRRTVLVTSTATGGGDGYSYDGVPSADGSRLLISSSASDLGAGPSDGKIHAYVSCLRNC
jgi:Tol biopolymer transport system component